MNDPPKNWSPVPLAICEACSFIWGLLLVGGTTFLIAERGWSPWWYVFAVFLWAGWTCKWCRFPGTAKEDKSTDPTHASP